MPRNLTPLGHARVYRHPATGELVVDTDSLRRSGFAGEFGYDDGIEGDDYDDFEGDDFGDEDDDFEGDYDDFGDEDDDDFEGLDFGEDDEDDEFGRRRRRRRRRRRSRRGRGARGRRRGRTGGRRRRPTTPKPKESGMTWGMTAVGGTDTLDAAGSASVKIRLQHDFRAQDITFTGSAAGAKVTSIFFGDRVVWSNSDGIDVSVFASNSFLRGLLKGQSLKAGLDVTVNGSLAGAGDFAATLIGQKPVNKSC